MTRVSRALACMAAGICVWAASMTSGQAAGAMAIGACAAYGYAFDYRSADAARTAAEGKCTGVNCKVVLMLRHSCGAFAIDGHRPCGPHGYASARRLGEAENVALKSCYKFGGKDCVIRAFACDVKG
ncbi:MAG TPA: DUF4189 domain-containing protein [Xanthobacteraceae bacterium]|nr:DUF4189 domain-containing protein [Xanthobacteraceae bacterium]